MHSRRKRILVWRKNGIYRFTNDTWEKVYSPARCDTIEIFVHDGAVAVSIKNHNTEEIPAFVQTRDNGKTWQELFSNDCLDLVLAMRGENIVTRWRGLCTPEKAGAKVGLALSAA